MRPHQPPPHPPHEGSAQCCTLPCHLIRGSTLAIMNEHYLCSFTPPPRKLVETASGTPSPLGWGQPDGGCDGDQDWLVNDPKGATLWSALLCCCDHYLRTSSASRKVWNRLSLKSGGRSKMAAAKQALIPELCYKIFMLFFRFQKLLGSRSF